MVETYLASVDIKACALFMSDMVVLHISLTPMCAISCIYKLVTMMTGAGTYNVWVIERNESGLKIETGLQDVI